MANNVQSHQGPVVKELQELLEIATREHGPQGRSTRRIEEALAAEKRRKAEGKTRETPTDKASRY